MLTVLCAMPKDVTRLSLVNLAVANGWQRPDQHGSPPESTDKAWCDRMDSSLPGHDWELIICLTWTMTIISTTLNPHIRKICPPKCKNEGSYGPNCLALPQSEGTFMDFYGIRTPIWDHMQTPTFLPYEPTLLGMGVVFNILR